MGRKSKAKKLIREALKEEKQKKLKKEKIVKSEKPKNKIKIHFPFKIIIALSLFLFFSCSTFFLILNSFKASEIARYFSEKNTVLTLELNSDFDNLQTLQAIKTLSKNSYLQVSNIKNEIGKLFSTDFNETIYPWLGRNAGFSLIRNEKQELDPIYFLEVKSIKKALSTFGITDTQRQIIPLPNYQFPKNDFFPKAKYLTIIDSYLFFSEESSTLTALLKMQDKTVKKVSESKDYISIKKNLPEKKLAFIYLNNKQITSTDLSDIETISGNKYPKEFILSLFKFYNSEGISVYEKDNQFVLKAYTNIKNPITNYSSKKPFKPSLVSYLPANTISFFETQNLQKELSDFEHISGQNLANSIELALSKHLLSSISFETDIKDLLNFETVFFLTDKGEIGIILEKTDDLVNEKLSILIHSLAQNIAGFEKEVITSELPDGSSYQEYIKVPKEMLQESEKYQETNYYFYSQDNKPANIYFAYTNDATIISQSPEILISILDKINTKSNLNNQDINTNNVFYLNLEKTLPYVYNPFSSLSIENNYQDGGIVSSTILNLK